MHKMKNAVNCHYYNNNKSCPYDDLGCMFPHKTSQQCKFGKLCSRKLCQYTHDIADDNIIK